MQNDEDVAGPAGHRPPLQLQARFWLALLAEILLLAALSRFDDWRYASMPVKFVETAVLCGIAFFAAASFFGELAAGRWARGVFWGVALVLRLLALPLEPGDDLWRYQWEGRIQNAGFNPYLLAPNDEELAPLRARFPNWSQINHRDYSAIYPPGTELVFAALSRLGAGPLVYKLLFAAADLAAAGFLLRLIGGRARYADAAWYAWNPLVVYSFAGAAHFDSLMILPLVGAILCFVRSRAAPESPSQWRWALLGAAALGAAISIKLVPVLLLPILVFALGLRACALAISLGIPALLSLPYGVPRVPIWESLGRFIYVARLNDMFWWLIEDTFWPNPHQKNYHYNVLIIIAVVLVSLFFIWNWKRGLLWVMGTALILSPVLHPWYCTWILPFATWRRNDAWQVLSITVFAYYLFWNERLFMLPWHSEPWLRGFILIPPAVAAIFALGRTRQPNESGDASLVDSR
ncbi:MAG TPA: phospholipid carrier-dependent glycosyltransferase [Chthoniobacterales bacterium]|nr:phospholipid carrier-dependent glycosyltransferase [Chthoniobacterales bacterium]